MGCQKTIALKILEKKADYVLALKGNQSSLLEDVTLFLDDLRKNKQTEKGGIRLLSRNRKKALLDYF